MFAFLLAAGDPGSQVGKNLGDMLHGFSTNALVGVVGIVAIGYLFGRQYNKLGVYLVAGLLVGAVVTSQVFPAISQAFGDAISKGLH